MTADNLRENLLHKKLECFTKCVTAGPLTYAMDIQWMLATYNIMNDNALKFGINSESGKAVRQP